MSLSFRSCRAKAIYIRGKISTHWVVLLLIVEQADKVQQGTTFAHIDKVGTVNIMLYSQPESDNLQLGAHWDIWHPDSIPALSRALDPLALNDDCRMAHPIISEMHYITPDISRSAFLTTGQAGWYII